MLARLQQAVKLKALLLELGRKGRHDMKQGQVSQEQISGILRAGPSAASRRYLPCAGCMGSPRRPSTGGARKYTGMTVPEAVRLRELERENARLKRLLAERDLELDATKELLAKKR
jgi:putative transposase